MDERVIFQKKKRKRTSFYLCFVCRKKYKKNIYFVLYNKLSKEYTEFFYTTYNSTYRTKILISILPRYIFSLLFSFCIKKKTTSIASLRNKKLDEKE